MAAVIAALVRILPLFPMRRFVEILSHVISLSARIYTLHS
jgi:hypothetical protein